MIDARLKQANGRLKFGAIPVRIERIGDRLYLRATFPPRPGSSRDEPHQQRIALGHNANPAGLQLAEQEARVVGTLLEQGRFDWSVYVKNDVQVETVADWVGKFERDYFTRRKRSPKSETTWRHDYLKVFGTLPPDQPLTLELLKDAIEATEPDSRTRKRFVDVSSRLAKFAGLDHNFKPLQGSYSSSSVIRTVPTDSAIAQFRETIPNPSWRWAYGMMATYGLRNHEVFHLDCSQIPLLVVKEGGKTGEHRVWPFYPEWFEAWELADVQIPSCTGKDNSALGNRVTHAFRRYGMPFDPYDLRHAWAVRTISFNLPIEMAARMMGHSVEVHTRCYQKWISEDFEKRVIERLMGSDRPLPP